MQQMITDNESGEKVFGTSTLLGVFVIDECLPEQQQEESQHGVQTWVLVADDSSETETRESAKSEQCKKLG